MSARSKVLAPLATVAAVAAVAVTATLLADGHSGSRSPRVLRLAAAAVAKEAATVSGGGAYRLTGELPAGKPSDASAWTLPSGPGPAEPVARLAEALHAGTPQRAGSGWSAGGLRVNGEAGRSWYFSPCGPEVPVTSEGPVGCAATDVGSGVSGSGSVSSGSTGSGSASSGSVSSGSATAEPAPATSPGSGVPQPPDAKLPPPPAPGPAPKTPTEADVRAAAAAVLDAVGLQGEPAQVNVYPGGGSLAVEPAVGGLRSVGRTTRVEVDQNGRLTGANGWLGEPVKADTYPLITAREAFDALPVMPRMMMSCPVSPQGGCQEPPPAEIIGAHLGLTVAQLAEGGQVLLPAWLFDVKGSDEPVPAVAVEPRYLSSGSDPGNPDPGNPPPGKPTQVFPAPSRSQLSFDHAYRSTTAAAVVVQYGDSGSCPHQNVQQIVKEDATTVRVFLDADSGPEGVACTDDYHPVKLEVPLQGPLGDRKVVDGSTGREIAVS